MAAYAPRDRGVEPSIGVRGCADAAIPSRHSAACVDLGLSRHVPVGVLSLLPLRRGDRKALATIITGERIQRLADVTLISRETLAFHRNVSRYAKEMTVFAETMAELTDAAIQHLSRANSVFVYTHDVNSFIELVWPRLQRSIPILITHNSDWEITARHASWLDTAGKEVRLWLAQNAAVRHPRIVPVPIGVSNTMWPHGNLHVLVRAMRRARHRQRPPASLFAQFSSSTHSSRGHAAAALRTNFPGAHVDEAPALPWRDYLDALSAHRFSACPRGNGIDIHRIWESLYLGVVPIVERSPLTEYWRAQGAPLVLIDNWDEVTPQRLECEAAHLNASAELPLLRLDTYRTIIERTVVGHDASSTSTPPA